MTYMTRKYITLSKKTGNKGPVWNSNPHSLCAEPECPIMAMQYTGEFKTIGSEVKKYPNSRLYSTLVF